jgi:hypothetical protein
MRQVRAASGLQFPVSLPPLKKRREQSIEESRSEESRSRMGRATAVAVAVLAVVAAGFVYLHYNDTYVFDQHELQAIAQKAIRKTGNGPVERLVDNVVAGLRARYGDHILAKPE